MSMAGRGLPGSASIARTRGCAPLGLRVLLGAIWMAALAACGAAALDAEGAAAADADQPSCAVCHGEEAQALKQSIHGRLDLRCTRCHGGDPSAMSREACVDGPEFVGVPSGTTIVEICASCHSDSRQVFQYGLAANQYQLYRESGHGRILYEQGDENTATCVSCHGSHSVYSGHDPRAKVNPRNLPGMCASCHADAELMSSYGLSPKVFDDYAESVHGKRLLAGIEMGLPTCSDCHGSHGAKPPGVPEVADICGHCHISTRDYFLQSPHFEVSERGAMEECISCHGSHRVMRTSTDLFLQEDEAGCGMCHQAVPPDSGFLAAREIAASIQDLTIVIDDITDALTTAQAKGLFIDAEKSYVEEARRVLIQTGPMTHAADPELIAEALREGQAMVQETQESLDVKARQFRDRRIVTSIIFIFILGVIGLLFVKWWEVHRWAEVEMRPTEVDPK